MDKNKQIIIAGILVIIVALVSAYFFYMQANTEAKKIDSLKGKIVIITEERMVLIKKIEEIKQKKEELSLSLQGYSVNIQNNEAELLDIDKEKEDVLTQLQAQKRALALLQQGLKDVKLEESNLKESLNKAKDNHAGVIQALESMRKKKSALEEKIKSSLETSRGVELRKIVVRMASPVNGNVIDVNREYNFSVINLGSLDNVKNGDVLGVYRAGTLIAKAIIENVYEDMSSIIVFDEWRDVQLIYGDTVKLLKS